MGSNEGHTDSSYNPAKSLAFDCPSCSQPDGQLHLLMCPLAPLSCYRCGAPVTGVWTGDAPTCDKCPSVCLSDPGCTCTSLYCSTCGVILAPHEVKLDLGDGDELICDACLGLSN